MSDFEAAVEGGCAPAPSTQHVEPPNHLDNYIEGPLRQIEAARKALHSPSLSLRPGRLSSCSRAGSYASDMRKYAEPGGHGGHNKHPGHPGRKCLSRTQMAEPYELSQELLDRQMEVLSNRYGGSLTANVAANTIQRAFRRYSMGKKFAAITSAAHVKTENRLSRRFAGLGPPDSVDGGGGLQHQQGFHHACCVYSSGGKTSYAGLSKVNPCTSQDNSPSSSSTGVTWSVGGQFPEHSGHSPSCHHPPHHAAPTTCVYSHATPPGGAGSHAPQCAASRVGLWMNATPHNHIGVRPGLSHDDGENSDAEIQSFPIDYLPDRSALSCVNKALGSIPNRQISSGNRAGPSHAHCANCGAGQALPSGHAHRSTSQKKRAPEVPKRTVSRLTTLDVGESSELYPEPRSSRGHASAPHSRTNSNQSSPRVGGGVQGHAPHQSHSHEPKLYVVQQQQPPSPASQNSTTPHNPMMHHRTSTQSQSRDMNRNIRPSNDKVDYAMSSSSAGTAANVTNPSHIPSRTKPDFYHTTYAVNEVIRKRHYRTGLNIFNKKPEKGITYLITKGFLDNSPQAIARFLITRKGLSKQMIGEYLGNIQQTFNQAVLQCFANEIDLSGLQIDTSLRKFQTYFRMPGEAQKIERLMEVFSQRYCVCNPEITSKLKSLDTIFILSFAIILLNTDLHTPNLKPEKRMTMDQFIRNLRGIDDGADVDRDLLAGVYDRIRTQEFKVGSDHVTQVMKVQQTIVQKCPNLAVPYRRLVCYCRLYEVTDTNKKERPGQHQREVFLFNDILVITKIHSRKKNSVTYTFRDSFPLTGMVVKLFETAHYQYGITLEQRLDRKSVVTLNARNDHDRAKFVEDLRESIAEMDEMETLRIESELEKQQANSRMSNNSHITDNRDSGVTDCDQTSVETPSNQSRYLASNGNNSNLKRNAINNSLLDLADSRSDSHHQQGGYQVYPGQDKPLRRGSVGSLDSGMSVSFQSGSAGSAGTVSQESSPQQLAARVATVASQQVFAQRKQKTSSSNIQSTNL